VERKPEGPAMMVMPARRYRNLSLRGGIWLVSGISGGDNSMPGRRRATSLRGDG
jgi:hypothetical protein